MIEKNLSRYEHLTNFVEGKAKKQKSIFAGFEPCWLDLGRFEKRHMMVNIPNIVSYLRALYHVSLNSLMNIWNENNRGRSSSN